MPVFEPAVELGGGVEASVGAVGVIGDQRRQESAQVSAAGQVRVGGIAEGKVHSDQDASGAGVGERENEFLRGEARAEIDRRGSLAGIAEGDPAAVRGRSGWSGGRGGGPVGHHHKVEHGMTVRVGERGGGSA